MPNPRKIKVGNMTDEKSQDLRIEKCKRDEHTGSMVNQFTRIVARAESAED